jgi:hypothetical protein
MGRDQCSKGLLMAIDWSPQSHATGPFGVVNVLKIPNLGPTF